VIPDDPERTLNMITVNQDMPSLQTVRYFVESVEGMDVFIFKVIGKSEDFVITFMYIYLS
jgi:hypothetical protein